MSRKDQSRKLHVPVVRKACARADMAAYGGAAAVAALGNQIFVTLQKGNAWPPLVVDVRVKYEETVANLKRVVERKTGVPADKQQLFWHHKELTAAYDEKTLLDMNLHTGFSLKGYDLTEEPDYWPPVKQTPEGLMVLVGNQHDSIAA